MQLKDPVSHVSGIYESRQKEIEHVEEAQRLLEDQQRRAESLRTRGGQIAGFGAAVLALIGGNATSLLAACDCYAARGAE